MEKPKRGRKPIDEKSRIKGVRIYIPQSDIDKIGGYEAVQEIMYLAVKRKIKYAKA